MPKTPDYFAGKTIVITGAGSGIGRATALIFAREGANVVCADINEKSAGETALAVNGKGSQALAVKADVTKRREVDALTERAIAAFGSVQFLFNSAGSAVRRAKFLDIDDALMEQTFALNVNGTLYAMQALLPHMLANKLGVIVGEHAEPARRPGLFDPLCRRQGRGGDHDDGGGARVCHPGHPRHFDFAGPGENRLPGRGRHFAGPRQAIRRRRADAALRRAGGDRRTRVVSLLRRLHLHDGGYGVCERRRRLSVTGGSALTKALEPGRQIWTNRAACPPPKATALPQHED